MEITLPEVGVNQKGVYKIIFDNKWFYIGSSVNLIKRFASWGAVLKTTNGIKNINIKNIIKDVSEVRFEILSICNTEKETRDLETSIIKSNWLDANILNRCYGSDISFGVRPYIGYVKPQRIKRGIPSWMMPQKIAVFTKGMELIKICNSKSELEREFKIRVELVDKIINGQRGQPRMVNIKKVSDAGEFIEPVCYKRPEKPKDSQKYKRKPVLQIDDNGDIVAVYSFYKEAAKAVGCSSAYMHRCLKMKFRGTTKEYKAKGFIWKYANNSLP